MTIKTENLFHIVFAMKSDWGYMATDRAFRCDKGEDELVKKLRLELGSPHNHYLLALCSPDKLNAATDVLKRNCRVSYGPSDSLRDSRGQAYFYTMDSQTGLDCIGGLLAMNTSRPMNENEKSQLLTEGEKLKPGVYFFIDEIDRLNERRCEELEKIAVD